MLIKLFLAFTIIPAAEIYLLVKAGGYLGAMNTLVVVILTGFAGATLARIQGVRTLHRIRESLQAQGVPSRELLDALLIFVAGVLLLTPGFITDTVGIVLLVPAGRAFARRLLIGKIRSWSSTHRVYIDLSSRDRF